MSSVCKNVHYYYNVSYFDKLEKVDNFNKIENIDLSEENKELLEYAYAKPETGHDMKDVLEAGGIKVDPFSLFTTYPGLLIGTGYAHDIKAKDGIKVGFSFDYVNGLPVIPGSTLKGVLRSYFPEKERKKYYNERATMIKEITGKENLDFEDLVKDIFYNKDVFIGAYPVIDKENNPILERDYITPHKNPLKDPVPIGILKVKPGVKYEFLFILNDSKKVETGLTKEEKLDLFKQLILLGGIGAKTNVGFGKFSEKKPVIPKRCDTVPSNNKDTGNSRRRDNNSNNNFKQGNNNNVKKKNSKKVFW